MPRIFITAFEPYEEWQENASWLVLVEFTRKLTPFAKITTRRYPVNFDAVRERLQHDLLENYDYVLHLGQAPGSSHVRLEAVGLNVGGSSRQLPESFLPLAADGPMAYRSALPLGDWATRLRDAGIPATISYHAGTYLCNATLYLAHHIAQQQKLHTQIAFVHVPLDTSQTANQPGELPSLPAATSARALHMIVEELVRQAQLDAPSLA